MSASGGGGASSATFYHDNIFAPCETNVVEGPEGWLWPLEDPVCVQRDGTNQGNVRERDSHAGEHPDCSGTSY